MVKKVRVGINGFGRIGRLVFRAMLREPEVYEVIAVNDLTPAKDLVYLLRYDSVHGAFKGTVRALDRDALEITYLGRTQTLRVLRNANPKDLPWGDLDVDVVLESTGRFTSRHAEAGGYQDHLDTGAKRVVLSAPAIDGEDLTVVFGVNENQLRPGHVCVSNGSCTTNCLAPIIKVIHEEFGVQYGLLTTVHAYTSDQNIGDAVHKNPRRARAAAINIVPTTTGAARAVGKVLPALEGRLSGRAVRVPVPDGSLVDLVAILKKSVTRNQLNQVLKHAAEKMPRIISYCEDPIVSSDIVGDDHSAIVDSLMTMTMPESGEANMVKVYAWYDNEWAYSVRTAELIAKVGAM